MRLMAAKLGPVSKNNKPPLTGKAATLPGDCDVPDEMSGKTVKVTRYNPNGEDWIEETNDALQIVLTESPVFVEII